MAKKKQMWSIWCGSCDVTIHLDFETITSTDQGAVFYEDKTYGCAECHSACMKELVEVEDDG